MLYCDLFEILLPVLLEADLLLPLGIELAHDVVEALLEAHLEDGVVVVASTHNRLVVQRILDLDFACHLVLYALIALTNGRLCSASRAHGGS